MIFKFIVQRFDVIQSTRDGERYVTFGIILIRRMKCQFVELEQKNDFSGSIASQRLWVRDQLKLSADP